MKLLTLPKLKSNPQRSREENPSGVGILLTFAVIGVGGYYGLKMYEEAQAKKKATAKKATEESASPFPEPDLPTQGLAYADNPPNGSGDPAGYNTTMFPDLRSVRQVLKILGYPIVQGKKSLTAADRAVIGRFQSDYNAVRAHEILGDWQGSLSADSRLGRHTLNGLEVAKNAADTQGTSWASLVADSNTTWD